MVVRDEWLAKEPWWMSELLRKICPTVKCFGRGWLFQANLDKRPPLFARAMVGITDTIVLL
jgi:hypothetical protein